MWQEMLWIPLVSEVQLHLVCDDWGPCQNPKVITLRDFMLECEPNDLKGQPLTPNGHR